jgi:hypothetical protein
MKHTKFEWVDGWRWGERIRGWKPTLETFIEHWQRCDTAEEVIDLLHNSLEEEGYSRPWVLTGDASSLPSRAGHWRNRGVPLKKMPVRIKANAGEAEKEKIARLTKIALDAEKNETIL